MIKKGINDNINNIKVRCKAILEDGRSCNRCFFVGAPGFDMFGKPKKQIVKCPKCRNYMLVRSEIEEKLVVEMIDKKTYEVKGKIVVVSPTAELEKKL